MKNPISEPTLALFGLVAMIPIGLAVVRGSLPVDQAALRAVIVLVVLAVIERAVVPFIRLALAPVRPGPGSSATDHTDAGD